jgi:hypothetical protein
MATQYTAGLAAGQKLTADIMNQIGAAWETWTPTLTQTGNVTFTTTVARYMRIQKLVIATFNLAVTGTGTGNSALTISLPITAQATSSVHGSCQVYDVSANTSYGGSFFNGTTTSAWFIGDWAAANVWGVAPNIAIANGDAVRGTLIYEAA